MLLLLKLVLALDGKVEDDSVLINYLNESIENSLKTGKLINEFGIPKMASSNLKKKEQK